LVIEEYLAEDIHESKDKMSYAYIRSGPKSDALMMGLKRIEFPRAAAKPAASSQSAPVGPAGPTVNLELEGTLGQLQNKCYHELVQACKDIAASIGVNQWTTIMGVQVRDSNTAYIHLFIS
jgi:hypothetical protein